MSKGTPQPPPPGHGQTPPQAPPPAYAVPPPQPYWMPPPMYAAPPPPPPPARRRQNSGGGFMRSMITFILFMMVITAVFFSGTLVGSVVGFTAGLAGSAADNMLMVEYRGGRSQSVAIIPIMGMIDAKQSSFVRRAVDKVLETKSIKVVVLRIDSPGGGVAASDQIWYQVQRLRDRKIPVIASYGGIAASGGYYVSCHADHIVAERTCITGSIGVIAQVMTMEGLMEKVGIEPVTLIASGSPQKSVGNDIFRSWNDADRSKITVVLDSAYDTFLERVTTGRSSAIEDPAIVRELANGSIYTAQQAMDNKLIDGIGFLDDAIRIAEGRAGLPKNRSRVVIVQERPTLFSDSLFAISHGDGLSPGIAGSGLDAESIRRTVTELASPRVMYLMP